MREGCGDNEAVCVKKAPILMAFLSVINFLVMNTLVMIIVMQYLLELRYLKLSVQYMLLLDSKKDVQYFSNHKQK